MSETVDKSGVWFPAMIAFLCGAVIAIGCGCDAPKEKPIASASDEQAADDAIVEVTVGACRAVEARLTAAGNTADNAWKRAGEALDSCMSQGAEIRKLRLEVAELKQAMKAASSQAANDDRSLLLSIQAVRKQLLELKSKFAPKPTAEVLPAPDQIGVSNLEPPGTPKESGPLITPGEEHSQLVLPQAEGPPQKPPGPRDSWTTKSGYAWDGRKWFRPPFSTPPSYPLRPCGVKGLWCDGVPYDSDVSRRFQQWEREQWEKAQAKP